jgi:hypothetical protein
MVKEQGGNMNSKRFILMAGLVLCAALGRLAADDSPPAASYEAEKAKALANPFANDLGPSAIDVADYPPEMQAAYKNILQVRCARCHTPSRPLNSQYTEVSGSKEEKPAKLAALKSSNPDLFTPESKYIWQVETDVWQRYVRRMMAKPGCNITNEEGKAVWKFLVYDSTKRKLGASKAAWKAHRSKLLADFKTKYPARYKELYGQ